MGRVIPAPSRGRGQAVGFVRDPGTGDRLGAVIPSPDGDRWGVYVRVASAFDPASAAAAVGRWVDDLGASDRGPRAVRSDEPLGPEVARRLDEIADRPPSSGVAVPGEPLVRFPGPRPGGRGA